MQSTWIPLKFWANTTSLRFLHTTTSAKNESYWSIQNLLISQRLNIMKKTRKCLSKMNKWRRNKLLLIWQRGFLKVKAKQTLLFASTFKLANITQISKCLKNKLVCSIKLYLRKECNFHLLQSHYVNPKAYHLACQNLENAVAKAASWLLEFWKIKKY